MKDILVPVSPGELLDKITILRIKSARIADPAKVANVRIELEALEHIWRDSGAAAATPADDETALQRVNEALWDIEDLIRDNGIEAVHQAVPDASQAPHAIAALEAGRKEVRI